MNIRSALTGGAMLAAVLAGGAASASEPTLDESLALIASVQTALDEVREAVDRTCSGIEDEAACRQAYGLQIWSLMAAEINAQAAHILIQADCRSDEWEELQAGVRRDVKNAENLLVDLRTR